MELIFAPRKSATQGLGQGWLFGHLQYLVRSALTVPKQGQYSTCMKNHDIKMYPSRICLITGQQFQVYISPSWQCMVSIKMCVSLPTILWQLDTILELVTMVNTKLQTERALIPVDNAYKDLDFLGDTQSPKPNFTNCMIYQLSHCPRIIKTSTWKRFSHRF